MLKISVGVETESCLQASMLKDIVQQKERLFASWPFLLLKKQVTTAQSACVDEKKQQKSQAERGNMESRSVRKEDFVKRQVDVRFFLLGRLRPQRSRQVVSPARFPGRSGNPGTRSLTCWSRRVKFSHLVFWKRHEACRVNWGFLYRSPPHRSPGSHTPTTTHWKSGTHTIPILQGIPYRSGMGSSVGGWGEPTIGSPWNVPGVKVSPELRKTQGLVCPALVEHMLLEAQLGVDQLSLTMVVGAILNPF